MLRRLTILRLKALLLRKMKQAFLNQIYETKSFEWVFEEMLHELSVAASSKTQLSTNTERASDAKKAYNSSFESFAAS